MSSVMKTLFLNPPSFEGFDGGAGARWPATREIASFWYPVWLSLSRRNVAGQPAAGRPARQNLAGRDHQDLQRLRFRGAFHFQRGL